MSHRRRDTLPRSMRRPAQPPPKSGRLQGARLPIGGRGSGPASAGGRPVQPRRISRREREARQRRQLYIGLGVAATLVVGILVFSSLNEYIFKPRAVVASVDGTDIRRRDYWKVRSVDLINQINQYQQFASLVDASQQQQYITLAQQAQEELDDVWGSTDLDETTLNRMVEDQIYLQNMEELGLEVTDADVQGYIDAQFQPVDAPLISPTPTPTLIPQRAEWATQTIEAEQQDIDGTFTPTPVPDASPVTTGDPASDATPFPVDGTPAASPVPGGDPSGSPVVGATAEDDGDDVIVGASSPVAGSPDVGSPAAGQPPASPVLDPFASPVVDPLASPVLPEATAELPTPNPEQARQTAEAGYDAYRDGVFDRAHLSEADYVRLVVRPAVAREKVRQALLADVGQTAEQVRASHILVDTKDLADSIYATLQAPGANFEQTAIDQSNDTGTAPNGGDLGWFARGQMVEPFENAAFSQPIGVVGAPVQSEFGWHIIKVYERDPARALTEQQIEQYRENIVNDWLAAQRAEMSISTDIEPSPTPSVSNFVPPPDAPPLPTETPAPEASPVLEASPVAAGSPIPAASPIGGASPVAEASPAPASSPVAEATPVSGSSPAPAVASTVTDSASPAATPIAQASPADVAAPVSSPVLPSVTSTVTTGASPAASPFASPVATVVATATVTPTP